MKKVKFFFRGGGIQSEVEEIVEFNDDTTDKTIDECMNTWLWEQSGAGWAAVEEEEGDEFRPQYSVHLRKKRNSRYFCSQ